MAFLDYRAIEQECCSFLGYGIEQEGYGFFLDYRTREPEGAIRKSVA